MDYQKLQLTKEDGKEARNRYYDGIRKLVDEKLRAAAEERKKFIDPRRLAENREEYRKKYVEMLGWPLTEYKEGTSCPFQKDLLVQQPHLKIYRLSLETLPGVWYQGLLFEPAERAEKSPLVINHPGALLRGPWQPVRSCVVHRSCCAIQGAFQDGGHGGKGEVAGGGYWCKDT